MIYKFVTLVCLINAIRASGVKQIIEIKGDVNIGVLIETCRNVSEVVPYRIQTLITSAVWTTERINYLGLLSPLKLGLGVYETCTESDYYKTIFDLYQQEEEYLLGLISNEVPSGKILKFCEVLDIPTEFTYKHHNYLLKASVEFLSAVGWTKNVTVLSPDENLAKEFYRYSKRRLVCVKDCIIYGTNCPAVPTTNPFVFFGYKHHIEEFVRGQNFSDDFYETNALFVPLDGSVPKYLPEKTYVVVPPHSPPSSIYKRPENILPTPLLFEIAKPILTYTTNIEDFITENCNDTLYKVNCLRSKFNKKYDSTLITPATIMELLRIEPLKDNFVYDIYKTENDTLNNLTELVKRNNLFQPYTKVFTYNVFSGELIALEPNLEINSENVTQDYDSKCISYFSNTKFRFSLTDGSEDLLNFRTESWVFAFLSLSFLGVLFCISILIFLLISIFRRDILEGNPILTISLLLAVMLLFCSVLPFSLESNKYTKHNLCLSRSLAVTLGYAIVFSLLLSRCILLATASKEIGFMSHIAGPVQSFLCLFIFGVQAALSIQIVGRCLDIFRGYSFVYLMSYNTMLLLLLLCLCPLIYKCQRNYREGKYFTIAIILTTFAWSIWLPCYALLNDDWKEPTLCMGLVSTGGIFLGAVFIPRTYLITIAAARDKITSTLPSLATATSAMDIYRANTQPIYDCVNVAAINAVAVARAGVATAPSMQTIQQPDLYSCPALPDDEDFDFRCDTPPNTDKVTRF